MEIVRQKSKNDVENVCSLIYFNKSVHYKCLVNVNENK